MPTVAELRALVKLHGVKASYKMNKPELEKIVSNPQFSGTKPKLDIKKIQSSNVLNPFESTKVKKLKLTIKLNRPAMKMTTQATTANLNALYEKSKIKPLAITYKEPDSIKPKSKNQEKKAKKKIANEEIKILKKKEKKEEKELWADMSKRAAERDKIAIIRFNELLNNSKYRKKVISFINTILIVHDFRKHKLDISEELPTPSYSNNYNADAIKAKEFFNNYEDEYDAIKDESFMVRLYNSIRHYANPDENINITTITDEEFMTHLHDETVSQLLSISRIVGEDSHRWLDYNNEYKIYRTYFGNDFSQRIKELSRKDKYRKQDYTKI